MRLRFSKMRIEIVSAKKSAAESIIFFSNWRFIFPENASPYIYGNFLRTNLWVLWCYLIRYAERKILIHYVLIIVRKTSTNTLFYLQKSNIDCWILVSLFIEFGCVFDEKRIWCWIMMLLRARTFQRLNIQKFSKESWISNS